MSDRSIGASFEAKQLKRWIEKQTKKSMKKNDAYLKEVAKEISRLREDNRMMRMVIYGRTGVSLQETNNDI